MNIHRVISHVRRNNAAYVFLLLAAAIMGPLLAPGYVLTLDMAWVPTIRLPEEVTNVYPLYIVLWLLDMILPSDVIQKVVLLGIFWLAGFGAFRLSRYLLDRYHEYSTLLPSLFAGVLFVANPYVYARFVDGQWLVLFGYALLPWLMRSAFLLAAAPSRRTVLRVVAWMTAISFTSMHTIFIALIALIVIVFAAVKKDTVRVALISIASVIGLTLIVNAFWIVPYATGQTRQAEQVTTFDGRHDKTFRTVESDVLPPELNVLTLHGYWGERQERFMLIQHAIPAWPILIGVIIIAVGVGFWRMARVSSRLTVTFGLLLVVGWILSLGTTSGVVGWANELLRFVVPFYGGYREPHKIAMLIALVYAVVGAWGVYWIAQKLRLARADRATRVLAAILVMGVPLAYGSLLLGGAMGQLRASDYPRDWHALNEYLRRNTDDGKRILFLPWRLYVDVSWAERTVANPARRFFDVDVIQSDDAGIGLIPNQSTRLETEVVERYVLRGGNHIAARDKLKQLGVQYVVVASIADWREYDYIATIPGLKEIRRTGDTVTYEIK